MGERKKAENFKYDNLYTPHLVMNCCLLGLTERQICQVIGIDTATWVRWREKYPAFDRAILEGREIADGKIAKSMWETAQDRQVEDEQLVKLKDADGSERVERFMVKRTIPADYKAMSFWLSRRQPVFWEKAKDDEEVQAAKQVTINVNKEEAEEIIRKLNDKV